MSKDKFLSIFSRFIESIMFVILQIIFTTRILPSFSWVRVVFWAFLFLSYFSFLYFGGVFNTTIISLALVGYEIIIAYSTLRASFCRLSTISYPMDARGIIVNYSF